MPLTGLKRPRRQQGKIREYKYHLRNTSSLIAIIFIFYSSALNGQSTNESESKAVNSDIQEGAHLPNGHKHYLTYQDFNKQAKNESYSRTENDLKTNKEIESISGSRSGAGIDIVGAKNQETAALVRDTEFQNENNNNSGVSFDVNPKDEIRSADDELLSELEHNEGRVEGEIRDFNHLDVQRREISIAADYGKRSLEDLIRIKEPFLYNLGLFLDGQDPAAKVANFGAPHNQRALLLSRFGYATLEASRKLTESTGLMRGARLGDGPGRQTKKGAALSWSGVFLGGKGMVIKNFAQGARLAKTGPVYI
ncbi:uncharacterized protein [Euwallacea similis]|uniref:uncharacterized protein n=1 Tax=Euwallacea similis TaxID=1736056 RepID=UPI00344F412F